MNSLRLKKAGFVMVLCSMFAVSCQDADEDTTPMLEEGIVCVESPESDGTDPEENEGDEGNTNTGEGN